MRIIVSWLLVSVFLFSCKKDDPQSQPFVLEAKTMLNVSYGNDPLQKMDVYLPTDRSTNNTKVIFLIHGGAWSSGDKTASNPFVDTLKRRLPSYAIININYRLSNGVNNLFPIQEQDVSAAVNFIYNKRTEYIISDKFVLAGESAGGHLSLLHAYKNSTPVKIKAVVSFFGPTDLTSMYNNYISTSNTTLANGLAQVIGATPASNPSIYSASSPSNYLSGAVPTIFFHGSNDPLVSPSQSNNIYQSLLSANISSSYTLYPGLGHGDDWTAATFDDAFNKITVFLNANVP